MPGSDRLPVTFFRCACRMMFSRVRSSPERVYPEIMLKQKVERDDDKSSRSTPARADQRERRRRRLHIKYPPAHSRCAISAGHDHAEQKKYFDLERKSRIGVEQAPDQARGKESVIQALIGGQHRRFRRLLDRIAEGLQAQRPGPEKHFQNEKIDMQRGNHRDQKICNPDHVAVPQPTAEFGWTLACLA